MSREIKFRAWDGVQMVLPQDDYGRNATPLTSGDILNRYENVMQYTGLKDKNGVEWYEGDILGLSDPEDDSRCWIIFVNGRFCKRFNGEDGQFNSAINVPFDPHLWQVIGNIYENPELLEAK